METARVDICYRPLRIAWAIRSDDRQAFRHAVRLTHTLYGGRFNPIVFIDHLEEAQHIVELFRVDVIIPIGETEEVKEFPKRFPYLISPLFPDELFLRFTNQDTRAHLLDLHNALIHWRSTSDWKGLAEAGIRFVRWADDDPLGDSFLVRYGGYPDPAAIGIDYGEMVSQAALAEGSVAILQEIQNGQPLPADLLQHPTPSYLSRHGLGRHYSIYGGWDHSGVFVGDSSDFHDLVTFWNLRAADIELLFVDPNHRARYEQLLPVYEQQIRARIAHLDEHRRKMAVWAAEERLEEAIHSFGGHDLIGCRIFRGMWHPGAVQPPMMMLGEESSLGVYGDDSGKPRVSFAFHSKPFSGDNFFYTQHLIASVALSSGDDQHTFHPPFVPEWNEFLARAMYADYRELRIEPGRIGIIITAADHDAFLNSLPVNELVERLFESAGFSAKLSSSGLITRQLIARVGGLHGARVFKIPGVRRLLKTHGPTTPFSKSGALSLIGGKDPSNPDAKFADHQDLYIEPRLFGEKLTPPMVFEYLVGKGLFRIGVTLTCPTCRLDNWIALDLLKQSNVCELCGADFDATRQLVGTDFRYRRTGVLGLEKNIQGAVPVTLVLQQLSINIRNSFGGRVYAPSYDLKPKEGIDLPECEVDFVMVSPKRYPEQAEVIFGECKDVGGIIDANDIANLRRVADALPSHRFDPYILLAKLSPFTQDEIELAKTLNGPYQNRVILLTARELEPYHLYERTQRERGIGSFGGSAAEMSGVTRHLYFAEATDPPASPSTACT